MATLAQVPQARQLSAVVLCTDLKLTVKVYGVRLVFTKT